MRTAQEILDLLNSQDEDIRLEAKTGSEVDRSIMETICSFSNEPGLDGGTIILGVAADLKEEGRRIKHYRVVGIDDPDKIQSDLASKCATMFNVSIRPNIVVDSIQGKNVILISVAELEDRAKPLYFKNDNLPRGAFRRIGPTDQRCTDDDMPIFYNSINSYDSLVVEDSSLDDIDDNAIALYRTIRARVNPLAEELDYDDSDLLRALGACKKDNGGEYKLTYTGLLVFGKSMAQRRLIPSVRVDYIRIPGNVWVENPDERFSTLDMRGPLILLVKRAYNAIIDDLPKGFVLENGRIQASSNIGLPEKTIREAIVNALIHRSYRVNQPIQIIRYSNRIEIINPGFSLKSEESLGEPGSVLRNPFISAVFHETNLAETKGSGIGVMKKLMLDAGMLPPTFESDHTRNQFRIRLLLHHFLCEKDVRWLASFNGYSLSDDQKLAIVFIREVGAIDNATYRQLCGLKPNKASLDLNKLTKDQLFDMKKHGNSTYYVISEKLQEKINEYNDEEISYPPSNSAYPPTSDPLSTKLGSFNPPSCDELSDDLREKIKSLGLRTKNKNLLDEIVIELCSIRPRSIDELAKIIHRTDNYVKNNIVTPLRRSGKLCFTIPEMKNHPGQKYTVK